MKGTIISYDALNKIGCVENEVGYQYTFNIEEWQDIHLPKIGQAVIFQVNGQEATDVSYEVSPQYLYHLEIKNKQMTASMLAFILGIFGAHKFYLGYTRAGVITLGLCLLGIVSHKMMLILLWFISWFEGLHYSQLSLEDFYTKYF